MIRENPRTEIIGPSPEHFVTPGPGGNGIGIGLAQDTKSKFGRVLFHPVFAAHRKQPLDYKVAYQIGNFCLN